MSKELDGTFGVSLNKEPDNNIVSNTSRTCLYTQIDLACSKFCLVGQRLNQVINISEVGNIYDPRLDGTLKKIVQATHDPHSRVQCERHYYGRQSSK